MSERLKLSIIYGSVRPQRVGIRAALYLVDGLGQRGFEPTLVDPAELDIPMLERRHSDYAAGEELPDLERLAAQFRQADAFVLVSGEYNHLPPPALTNLLSHFRSEFSYRPAAIATYSGGGMAGVRAGSHLRDMMSALSMIGTPMALAYPRVQTIFAEDGSRVSAPDGPDAILDSFAAELRWYAEALKAQRELGLPA